MLVRDLQQYLFPENMRTSVVQLIKYEVNI